MVVHHREDILDFLCRRRCLESQDVRRMVSTSFCDEAGRAHDAELRLNGIELAGCATPWSKLNEKIHFLLLSKVIQRLSLEYEERVKYGRSVRACFRLSMVSLRTSSKRF